MFAAYCRGIKPVRNVKVNAAIQSNHLWDVDDVLFFVVGKSENRTEILQLSLLPQQCSKCSIDR